MKPLQFIACSVALALSPLASHSAPPAELQDVLTEGQLAYNRGDLEKAKAAFEMVYKIDPRNTVAIGYLRRIKSDEGQKPKGNDQEKQLATLIIPKVEFRDATLRESLEALRKKVNELSSGKQTVNFVVPPGEPADSARVTLSLANIPFPEAVRYIGKVTNFDFTYDKYAIVGKPTAATATTSATTAAPQ